MVSAHYRTFLSSEVHFFYVRSVVSIPVMNYFNRKKNKLLRDQLYRSYSIFIYISSNINLIFIFFFVNHSFPSLGTNPMQTQAVLIENSFVNTHTRAHNSIFLFSSNANTGKQARQAAK